MDINKRNHYSTEYKTKVVLEVLREEATVNEIATKYGKEPESDRRFQVASGTR